MRVLRAAATLAAVTTVLLATACTTSPSGDPTGTAASSGSTPTVDAPGGTLSVFSAGPVGAWDPQRISTSEDMAFATRTFVRTLTAYQASADPTQPARVVGDLATGAGTADASLKTWTFALRDGITWQDGSPVTCEDIRYGISRTFATSVITGGPTDALAVLAVPREVDGRSMYAGPWATGAAQAKAQAAFDKAVACSGPNITFTLSTPVSDFAEMLTIPAFAPVKKSEDDGSASPYAVFSSGPYRLKDPWVPGKGGTWVRNEKWQPASDPLRHAFPDQIVHQEGVESGAVAQQILSGGATGRSSLTLSSVPPALHQQIAGVASLRDRMVNPASGLVDYLALNMKSPVFAKEGVRQALATATNRAAYVTAIGPRTVADPTTSVVPAAVRAVAGSDEATNPLGAAPEGDPVKAAALLRSAGVTGPVPIRVAYRSSDTADKAMAALVAGWTRAGFAPTLQPIEDGYFEAISAPARVKQTDVFWSNWAPLWASASTVLPPLFDSRINLATGAPGRDYGWFASTTLDAAMTKAHTVADRAAREKAWLGVDAELQRTGAYIGLAERRSMYIGGDAVFNLSALDVLGGSVDLSGIAVRP